MFWLILVFVLPLFSFIVWIFLLYFFCHLFSVLPLLPAPFSPSFSLYPSLSQRPCPELCSKHLYGSVLLSDRPTVRLFSLFLYYAVKPPKCLSHCPLQFDTVADCVEISNVILKSYTVYSEVWECGFLWVALLRMFSLFASACFVCVHFLTLSNNIFNDVHCFGAQTWFHVYLQWFYSEPNSLKHSTLTCSSFTKGPILIEQCPLLDAHLMKTKSRN